MLKRISELLQKNESFSIETTLSTRSYFRLVEKSHQQGYDVTLGLDNLFKIYLLIVDTWILVNNSETPRSIVATGGRDQETTIKDNEHFKIMAITSQLAQIIYKCSQKWLHFFVYTDIYKENTY